MEAVEQWDLIGDSEASTVCVHNKAAFVLKWHMNWNHTKSEESEHFPVGKTHCMDIAEALPGIQDGDHVKVHVDATAGKTEKADHAVVYKADSLGTTTFRAHGTTFHFKVEDEDDWYMLNQYERFATRFATVF